MAAIETVDSSRPSISPRRSAEQSQQNPTSINIPSPSERTKRARAEPPPPLQLDLQVGSMGPPSLRSSEEAQQKEEQQSTQPRRSVRSRNLRQASSKGNNRLPAKGKDSEKSKEKEKEEESTVNQHGEPPSMALINQKTMVSVSFGFAKFRLGH
jgi:hypothetical protein